MLRPSDMQAGTHAVTGSRQWALFLDLDGTLLDIAESPSAVRVPDDLLTDLVRLRDGLSGAVAIVSGRALSDIDRLMFPLVLPAGAEHGSAVRDPLGHLESIADSIPAEWIDALQTAARNAPGVLIEVKHHAVAIHYRQALQYQPAFEALAAALVATKADRYEIMPARRAFEIRRAGINKGVAVKRLMQDARFAGRIPVFIGDDHTDEAGIAACEELGGFGLRVGDDFKGSPAAVRDWLKSLSLSLSQTLSATDKPAPTATAKSAPNPRRP